MPLLVPNHAVIPHLLLEVLRTGYSRQACPALLSLSLLPWLPETPEEKKGEVTGAPPWDLKVAHPLPEEPRLRK